jgi:ABC-type glycerol-3-phosphate transport system permease component
VKRALRLLLLVVVTVLLLFPFYWTILTSLQPRGAVYTTHPSLLPQSFRWQSYVEIFHLRPFARWLENSFAIALGTTVLSLALAIPAAYSFGRYSFKGKGFLAITVLTTQMLPASLIVIPLYLAFLQYNLLESKLGVILAHASMTLPYSIWMLRGFFGSIPVEIEEAALVDGCSRFGAMLRVSLPVALPGIVGTGLYAFETSWNEYLFARSFISQTENMVVSVGIGTFIGEYTIFWHQIMAAAVISALPALVIFFIFQRYLVHGLSAGSVKG